MITLLLWLALLWFVIACTGFLALPTMRFARYQPLTSEIAEPVFVECETALGPEWLADTGFVRDTVLSPMNMRLAFWLQPEQHVSLMAYTGQHAGTVDLITQWPGGVGLTTSNSGSIGAFTTPPGDLKQGLPGLSPQALHAAHLDAVALVVRRLGKQPHTPPKIGPSVRAGICRQLDHYLWRPWLILTIPYRFFVTRFQMRGVTLTQQDARRPLDWDKLARLDLN